MEIAYYGRGRVGSACREVVERLGISITDLDSCDFLISVHWDKIFTKCELAKPRHGGLNLHNSYLPWNRGAHSCTWAIADQSPHGATMHWMDEGIDTGPILYQERVEVSDSDTADSLYKKTADAEVRVFTIGMELLLAGNYRKYPQPQHNTVHRKKDFDRLVRALTTSDCKVIRET